MKLLLDSEDKWTKGAFARDKHNVTVSVFETNKTACKWCLLGAVQEVASKFYTDTEYTAWELELSNTIRAYLPNGYHWLDTYNDSIDTTYADIIELLDSVIEGETE